MSMPHLPQKLSLSVCPEMIFPQSSRNLLNFTFGIYGFGLISAESPVLDDKCIENMKNFLFILIPSGNILPYSYS